MIHGDTRRLHFRRLMFLPCAVVLYALAAMSAAAATHPTKAAPAAGRAAQSQCKKVNRAALAADIERYKKESGYGLEYKWELINCREALPVLQKYALDSDAHIRGLVGDFLARNPSAKALRILASQVTRHPLDENVVHQINAYPCEDIRKTGEEGLSAAIIERLKARPEHAEAEETYVLKCLAPKDPNARRFLEEVRGDPSQTMVPPS